jgi:hypothetical protein
MHHLTPEQIERYASRSGSVDEILAAAQHFEVCAVCRDRAAALLDPGIGEVGHTRKKRRISGGHPALEAIARKSIAGRPLVLWIIAAAVVAAVVVFLVVRR